MTHGRKGPKGSFGGKLDDLVKEFPQDPPKGPGKLEKTDADGTHLNERLFEAAWRKAREGHQLR